MTPADWYALGSKLLKILEEQVLEIGVNCIWTWTAGYEAPKFYQKQGYEIFAEMEKVHNKQLCYFLNQAIQKVQNKIFIADIVGLVYLQIKKIFLKFKIER